MELPFAVDYSASESLKHSQPHSAANVHNDDESLVTASSQRSLIQSETNATIDYSPSPRLFSAVPFAATASQAAATSTTTSNKLLQIQRRDIPQSQPEYDDGLDQVLTQYGVATDSQHVAPEAEFTYVTVGETDDDEVDIVLMAASDGSEDYINDDDFFKTPSPQNKGDLLAMLLTGSVNGEADALVQMMERANQAVQQAALAKRQGNLQKALDAHATAAKLFKNAATAVKEKNGLYLAGSSSKCQFIVSRC
jgi:hypothetical protein